MTKEHILTEVMSLQPPEREALAEEILLSLTDADAAEIDAAWLAEVERREQALERGESTTYTVDEVLERVRCRKRP